MISYKSLNLSDFSAYTLPCSKKTNIKINLQYRLCKGSRLTAATRPNFSFSNLWLSSGGGGLTLCLFSYPVLLCVQFVFHSCLVFSEIRVKRFCLFQVVGVKYFVYGLFLLSRLMLRWKITVKVGASPPPPCPVIITGRRMAPPPPPLPCPVIITGRRMAVPSWQFHFFYVRCCSILNIFISRLLCVQFIQCSKRNWLASCLGKSC